MNKDKKTDSKAKFKVFIIDNHPVFCKGLSMLIEKEKDFTVCGSAGEYPAALQAMQDTQPDITITDIAIEDSSGLRRLEALTAQYQNTPTLVMSAYDESLYAERCLRAGANGYIMKNEPPEKVISALKTIIGGDIYVSEILGAKLLHKLVTKKESSCSPIELLSNRELEVFDLIGNGLKTRVIAEQLNLSIKTIETYVAHIKKKMNFKDSRSLFLHAVQWSISKDSI